MNWGIENKRVLITGGSRGIGRGIALAFAKAGAHVCFTYQSQHQKADETLAELGSVSSDSIHKKMSFHVGDETAVEENLSRLCQEWGLPDYMIHNAGITRDQILLRMKTSDWDDVLSTNLKSAFLLTKFIVKAWLKAKHPGAIVHISSIVGQTGNPGQANYAASKAGLIGFAKSVAMEVASRQIRINCVAPGFIQSDMTDQLGEAQKKAFLDRIPLKTEGLPADVANACLFLVSDYARYITGQTLNVSGGLHMS